MTPKTFVVPLDGSEFAERALPVAEALAARIGGGLLLFSAQHFGPLDPAEYLEEVAQRHSRCPVEIESTKETYASGSITDIVEAAPDRVVCMTTHGRGRLRWAALGSVAEEVVRTTRRPTVLVGRNCRPDFLEHSSHLLACSDGTGQDDELAAAAREWSDLFRLSLDVAVVVHPLDVESAEHPGVLLDPVAAQFGGAAPVAPVLLRSSFVPGALADYAEQLPAAIVATRSHTRTGMARVALGSVTMGLLHLLPCPLLVTHQAATEGEGTP
jgi:nucleotide-binding universal stress UspA family protein